MSLPGAAARGGLTAVPDGSANRGAGFLWLLRPKLRSRLNRARTDQGRVFKGVLLGFATTFFWALIFAVIFRMLLYFRGTQGIGDLLASKLLGLAFLTFLSLLLLSNVITALSTFFLAEDLELLVASPTDTVHLYGARLLETVVDSSWMVALLAVPLLAAYGVVYGAGPLYYLLALATLASFLVIPAVLGSAFTLLLVNVFPARRTRDECTGQPEALLSRLTEVSRSQAAYPEEWAEELESE